MGFTYCLSQRKHKGKERWEMCNILSCVWSLTLRTHEYLNSVHSAQDHISFSPLSSLLTLQSQACLTFHLPLLQHLFIWLSVTPYLHRICLLSLFIIQDWCWSWGEAVWECLHIVYSVHFEASKWGKSDLTWFVPQEKTRGDILDVFSSDVQLNSMTNNLSKWKHVRSSRVFLQLLSSPVSQIILLLK